MAVFFQLILRTFLEQAVVFELIAFLLRDRASNAQIEQFYLLLWKREDGGAYTYNNMAAQSHCK